MSDPFERWLSKGQGFVDPDLVDATIKVESSGNPNAVSDKGAQGLMQLMPTTAKMLGITDPKDPKQNKEGGTKYLAYLMDKFKDYGADAERMALAAYDRGETYMAHHTLAEVPEETKNHGDRIIREKEKLKSRPDSPTALAARMPPKTSQSTAPATSKGPFHEWISKPIEQGIAGTEKMIGALLPDNEGGKSLASAVSKAVPELTGIPSAARLGDKLLAGAPMVKYDKKGRGGAARAIPDEDLVDTVLSPVAGAVLKGAKAIKAGVEAADYVRPGSRAAQRGILDLATPEERAAFTKDSKVMPEDEAWDKHRIYYDPNDDAHFKEIGDDRSILTGKPLTREKQTLGDVLRHDELYARRPEMMNVGIRLGTNKELGEAEAHYNPNTKTIVVRKELAEGDPDELKSVILHESQHHLDDLNNVDPGFNSAHAKALSQDRAAIADVEYKESTGDLGHIGNSFGVLKELSKNPDMPIGQAIDKLIKDRNHYGIDDMPEGERRNIERYVQHTIKASGDINKALAVAEEDFNFANDRWKASIVGKDKAKSLTNAEARDLYRRNVGENRASVVQTRMNLTQGERGESSPPMMMREKLENQVSANDGYGGKVPSRVVSRSEPPVPMQEALGKEGTTLAGGGAAVYNANNSGKKDK